MVVLVFSPQNLQINSSSMKCSKYTDDNSNTAHKKHIKVSLSTDFKMMQNHALCFMSICGQKL